MCGRRTACYNDFVSENRVRSQARLQRAVRREAVAALQRDDGGRRRNRSVTFTDRKKEASRKACRKGSW